MHKKAIICAQIVGIRKILTKRGKKLVILGMDDSTGRLDVVVFGELFESSAPGLTTGDMLVIEGEVAHDDYNDRVKMTANHLYDVPAARTKFARCLELRLHSGNQGILGSIQALLKAHVGRCAVQLSYRNDYARAQLSLAQQWHVMPSDELLGLLMNLLGDEHVVMKY